MSGPGHNGPLLPGSAEHTYTVHRHDEAVDRVAKLRKMQSALPAAIAEAEALVRDLAARLGLPPVPREKRAAPGATQRAILTVLPATQPEIVARAGITKSRVNSMLQNMKQRGQVFCDEAGVWRATTEEAQAA